MSRAGRYTARHSRRRPSPLISTALNRCSDRRARIHQRRAPGGQHPGHQRESGRARTPGGQPRHRLEARAGTDRPQRQHPGDRQQAGAGHANACACTPATARPEGSAIAAKLASQAIAAGEEQAIDLPPGTVSAAAGVGNARSNRLR